MSEGGGGGWGWGREPNIMKYGFLILGRWNGTISPAMLSESGANINRFKF